MAEETQVVEPGRGLGKRKFGKIQGRKKSSKKQKVMQPPHGQKKVKINQKMKKLYNKRAREYNSDDDEDETTAPATMRKTRGVASMKTRGVASITKIKHEEEEEEEIESEELSEDEGAAGGQRTQKKVNFSEDEGEDDDDEIQPGITKFSEGCKAFKMAFKNIIKKSVSDDLLGPVLSAHKNLVIEKLAEEEAERKVKGEAKKEKLLIAEKGHVKPANYLDSHEKFLISVATKGVVKLFNAVNKAQVAQKGLDPSKNRDAKELKKRTKEAFYSELGRPAVGTSAKANTSTSKGEDEQPSWAPLRDNYMLTNSRIKDWDKNMPGKNESDDMENISEESSSDED
ncbi:unnamed protein product [Trifolium pratense]|uniref:Uncharacterized protein n=1 Tax=Trifolium pratense TaxID=57577 RepID=A0ACB0IMC2_TRIPR|nr:unnamed protein product [Trifolium pratense]